MSVASLRDVAQAAGVSVTTVSRFLNGTLDLPERTRMAVEVAILELNYLPNPHARRLSRGRSDTIGLVVPDVATPFFATLVAAIEAEDTGTAGGWPDQVEQQADCRRFPRSVRPEKPEYLATLDAEVETVERKLRPVRF